MPDMVSLPIDAVIPEILRGLAQKPNLVLKADPGAGKSTRLPAVLLQHGFIPKDQQWLLLQPRRVAARATARRLAEELQTPLGDLVGYQVRWDERVSAKTRLSVMTEGILLKRWLSDPYLSEVGGILFDEFHERRLDCDLAIAMAKLLQTTVRPDLRIVVMSATMEVAPLADWLEDAITIESAGRCYPVKIEYAPQPAHWSVGQQAAAGVEHVLAKTRGDLLVFLPGIREIRDCYDILNRDSLPNDTTLVTLYGEMSAEEQDRVFQKSPLRKIILATNVAETSLTIDGVTTVVDTGWARQMDLDRSTGLNRLRLVPISQAAADQRAGRAGRTGPGCCLRLWSEASQRTRPQFERPEIERLDLAGAVLQLWCAGETDLKSFPWFQIPTADSIERAESDLSLLGCGNRVLGVTATGKRLSEYPLEPRLAKVLDVAVLAGYPAEGGRLVALLSEKSPFEANIHRRPTVISDSDLLVQLEGLVLFEKTGRTESAAGRIRPAAADQILRVAKQLESVARCRGGRTSENNDPTSIEQMEQVLLRAIWEGFSDRLVKRRSLGSLKGLMVGGKGVRQWENSAVRNADLYVAIQVDADQGEAVVRQASAVPRNWLQGTELTSSKELELDSESGQLRCRLRTRWHDLLLEESPAPLPEGEELESSLISACITYWPTAFPVDAPSISQTLARIECLRDWFPNENWPTPNAEWLQKLLPEIVPGCRGLDDVRKGAWLGAIHGALGYERQQRMEWEAPEFYTVPTGNRIRLEYHTNRPPVLAVRIQELFGLTETPTICRGRVKLLLHLLAPNFRTQQVTDDLASFWKNAYPVVKGELKRRYPRHAWPEDPLTAKPEYKPGGRK